jgi:hypothetical protein
MLDAKPATLQPGEQEGRGKPLPTPDPLDDLFHHCALRGWAEIYEETDHWPPDSEQTRRRAYDLYETEKRKESRP